MTDIRGLGYLRVQTTDVPRWRELTVECLAMAETDGPVEGGLYLRQDERKARLIVLPGEVAFHQIADRATLSCSEHFPRNLLAGGERGA